MKTQLVQLNLETKITQLQYPKDKNANKLKQFLFSPYFSVYTHIHTHDKLRNEAVHCKIIFFSESNKLQLLVRLRMRLIYT